MWGFQIAVGVGLVLVAVWARRRGRAEGRDSLWWIPLLLGVVSLSVSTIQRVSPHWSETALRFAFVAIGILVVFTAYGLRRRS